MANVHPVVRFLVPCENIIIDPGPPIRVTLDGVISTIHSLDQPAFPYRHAELCIFAQLTECRGSGKIRLEAIQADTGQVVFRTRELLVTFGNDPLAVRGLPFRIFGCLFPDPGVYWIDLIVDGTEIARQVLLLR
jgi:hypothetical protein